MPDFFGSSLKGIQPLRRSEISFRNPITIRRVATVIGLYLFSKGFTAWGVPRWTYSRSYKFSTRPLSLFFFISTSCGQRSNFSGAPNPILSRVAHNGRKGRYGLSEKEKFCEEEQPLWSSGVSEFNYIYTLSFGNLLYRRKNGVALSLTASLHAFDLSRKTFSLPLAIKFLRGEPNE